MKNKIALCYWSIFKVSFSFRWSETQAYVCVCPCTHTCPCLHMWTRGMCLCACCVCSLNWWTYFLFCVWGSSAWAQMPGSRKGTAEPVVAVRWELTCAARFSRVLLARETNGGNGVTRRSTRPESWRHHVFLHKDDLTQGCAGKLVLWACRRKPCCVAPANYHGVGSLPMADFEMPTCHRMWRWGKRYGQSASVSQCVSAPTHYWPFMQAEK